MVTDIFLSCGSHAELYRLQSLALWAAVLAEVRKKESWLVQLLRHAALLAGYPALKKRTKKLCPERSGHSRCNGRIKDCMNPNVWVLRRPSWLGLYASHTQLSESTSLLVSTTPVCLDANAKLGFPCSVGEPPVRRKKTAFCRLCLFLRKRACGIFCSTCVYSTDYAPHS